MVARLLAAALAAALAAGARAQDRPSEDELFGGPTAQPNAPAPEAKPAPPPPGGAAGPHGDTEAQLFGSQSSPNAPPPPAGSLFGPGKEDWLKVGGQLQLRGQVSAYEDTAPRDWILSSPNLLDVYLDARPNDRVRAFVLGRMNYDPTADTTSTRGGTITGFNTSSASNPGAVLDQMWVNFDLYHRVFVTAGRQHVKWGVGKFWNPTDFLHPVQRNPLATFDVRTGTSMIKLHLPWEKRGWNFYGMAVLDDLSGNPQQNAGRLNRMGAGGRAELVLGGAELGLDAVAQDGHHPRYGIDLSRGLWDFDLYAEAALRSGGDSPRWTRTGEPPPGPLAPFLNWQRVPEDELTPQVVVGGTWSLKYSDQDSLTLGAEYFYNGLGYDSSAVYPFLLAGAPAIEAGIPPTITQQDPNAFRPFYLGKHYAAVNLYLPQPGRWNDATLIFTVLGNLSDRSYVARFDASVLVLTYMTVETFVAGHFGQTGGEFRLVVPPELGALAGTQTGATFPAGPPLVDVGVALRVAL
jgi:hypothetical protein